MSLSFKNYFSEQSVEYKKYRPTYPQGLFELIASSCHDCNMAWDCATGSGQAAYGLTPFFDQIIATDASENQISNSKQHQKIKYLPLVIVSAKMVI